MTWRNSVFSRQLNLHPLCQFSTWPICALIVIWFASGASAALLVYEPFDYPAGERVLGQTNPSTGNDWLLAAAAGASGDTTAINTASGNLSPPPALGDAVGNSATITGVGNLSGAANRLGLGTSFDANSGDTVYYSLLLRIDDVSNSNTGVGGFFIGLNNLGNTASTTNPGSVAARLQVRQDPGDPTKYNLGIVRQRAPTAAEPITSWSGPMTPGETLFVVGSSELVAGTQNDIARLWINPDPSTFGAASPPPATLTDDTTGIGTDIGVLSVLLRQSPAPFLTLDELRVGTTWAAVTVPEPATIALFVLGAIALLARRRTSMKS
jgi:hypothetical protein